MKIQLEGKDRAGHGLDRRHRSRDRQGPRGGGRRSHGQWQDTGKGRGRRRRDHKDGAWGQGPRRRRQRLHRGRLQQAGDGVAGSRHSHQQCRDIRTQGLFETPDEDWRRFFEVNVLSGVRLSPPNSPACCGAIGAASSSPRRKRRPHPDGDDPLRHDQDRAARGVARAGRATRGTAVTVIRCCRAQPVGGRRNLRQGAGKAERPVGGAGGGAVRQAASPDLAAAALCKRRGGRQDGHLHRFKGGVGDQWRGAPRRRRHRPDHRVSEKCRPAWPHPTKFVMPGLVPGIHVFATLR